MASSKKKVPSGSAHSRPLAHSAGEIVDKVSLGTRRVSLLLVVLALLGATFGAAVLLRSDALLIDEGGGGPTEPAPVVSTPPPQSGATPLCGPGEFSITVFGSSACYKNCPNGTQVLASASCDAAQPTTPAPTGRGASTDLQPCSAAAVGQDCDSNGTKAYKCSATSLVFYDASGNRGSCPGPVTVTTPTNPVTPPTTPTTPAVPTPAPIDNKSSFVSQTTVPAKVTPGQKFEVTVIMKNDGNTAWTPGNYSLRPLEKSGDLLANAWGIDKVDVAASYAPTTTAPFVIKATAPSNPGTYAFFWRMHSQSALFGASTTLVEVVVEKPAAPLAWNPVSSLNFGVAINESNVLNATSTISGSISYVIGAERGGGPLQPGDKPRPGHTTLSRR